MVQFNLLPDVKLEYVKVRRTRNLMAAIALVVGAVSLGIMLFSLFYVQVVQRKSLSDLNDDITKYSKEIKNIDDLDQILTVQNQLRTLTGLHNDKPSASRLFGFITQVTPSQASLNKLGVNFAESKMTIGGAAPTLDVVSTYTDTLKATKFITTASNQPQKAFSEVVLSSFARDDKGATFTITLKYEPTLFKMTEAPQLIIPKGVVTNQSNVFKAGN